MGRRKVIEEPKNIIETFTYKGICVEIEDVGEGWYGFEYKRHGGRTMMPLAGESLEEARAKAKKSIDDAKPAEAAE